MAVWNPTDKDIVVNKGDRICQLCSPDQQPLGVAVVDDLSRWGGGKTSRGEGGFGSTGS